MSVMFIDGYPDDPYLGFTVLTHPSVYAQSIAFKTVAVDLMSALLGWADKVLGEGKIIGVRDC